MTGREHLQVVDKTGNKFNPEFAGASFTARVRSLSYARDSYNLSLIISAAEKDELLKLLDGTGYQLRITCVPIRRKLRDDI